MESRAWPVRVAFPFFPASFPSRLFSSLLARPASASSHPPPLSISLTRPVSPSATNCVARPRATSTAPYALNVAQEDDGAARTMDLGRLAARRLADGAPFAQRRCSSIARTFTRVARTWVVRTCADDTAARRTKKTPMAMRRGNTRFPQFSFNILDYFYVRLLVMIIYLYLLI